MRVHLKSVTASIIVIFMIFLSSCSVGVGVSVSSDDFSDDGDSQTTGQVVLTIDEDDFVARADVNCTVDGNIYTGYHDTANNEVYFIQMGACTTVSGEEVDTENCSGTLTGTCNGLEGICQFTGTTGDCSCALLAESDNQGASTTLILEWDTAETYIYGATATANSDGCEVSGNVYTCSCE